MLEGLFSTAAGLSAQQLQLDAIGNDLANVNTDGYKSERVAFQDLLYGDVKIAGTDTTTGAGAASQVIGRSSAQGALRETGDPLDVAIEGDGFIQVALPGGGVALTRDGGLSADATGTVVTAGGNRLVPPIKLPRGVSASQLGIAADGTVTAGTRVLGRIKLVTVVSPGHLQPVGGSLLAPTAQSGAPRAATGARLHQGALEQSNVDLGSEMTALVTTQRNFQMNSEALQDESQMMSIANQLRPA